MKVKAKWAVKVNGEWYKAGDVFEVDSTAGLLGAVEVLKTEAKHVPEKKENVPAKEEPKQEPKASDEPTPRTATRTRKKMT